MRKYFFLIIFNSVVLLVKAQGTQTLPTDLDAISFINKVSAQSPSITINSNRIGLTNNSKNTYWKIELRNCKLYFFYWKYYENFQHNNSENDPQGYGDLFICDVIDLQNVAFSTNDNNLMPGYNGAIKEYELSKLGNYGDKHADSSYYTKCFNELQNFMQTNSHTDILYKSPYKDSDRYGKYEGEVISTANTYDVNTLNILIFTDTTLELFIENNYSARLKKAYAFLIKNCGGGKVVADPNSKF